MRHLSALDILLGVAMAIIWGMGFVFAKAAVAHFPPILLMALRFAVTAAVLVWFFPLPRGQLVPLLRVSVVAASLQYSLTFTGLKSLDASVVSLIVQLEVPFMVLLGWLALGETPGRRKWLGIALAFAGVALIVGAPRVAAEWGAVALVVSGAMCWAVGQTMVRALRDIGGMTVTAWTAVLAAPQLLVMSLIFERGHAEAVASAGPVVWAAVLYLGLVMTAVGYGIWNTLLRRHPISLVAPFLLLMPVSSAAGGVLFLGEVLTAQILAGGAIVIAGLGFILLDRAPRPRATVPPG